MLRLFTSEEGAVMNEAMRKEDETVRARIIAELAVQPHGSPTCTSTYMPAALVNLLNNPALGKSKEERLAHAITLGLPFITRVLEKHKALLASGEMDPNIHLNFNKIAGVAKTSPHLLRGEFNIDQEGNVFLVE